ncbi:MAG: PAS domain-containing sensor histidine kinase [Acetobacteraceae bacterium]|nr:PAS domain-containing sensor histidine kinase [Acetobacteraceae bacterium]
MAVVSVSERRARKVLSWLSTILLGKLATLVLSSIAVVLGIVTFILLARGTPLGVRPEMGVALVLANLVVLLILGAALAGRLTRVILERRRGAAGARLHVRLVLLFSGVAVVPTIVVAVFAVSFFNFGIRSWFNEPVRSALMESLKASQGYLKEHRNTIRATALEMANDLTQASSYLETDPLGFADLLTNHTILRGLTETVVFEPTTGQVVASAGLFGGVGTDSPPAWATERASAGDVAVLASEDRSKVRAVVQLQTTHPLLLLVGRPVDPQILEHMARTEWAVAEYQRLDQNHSWLQLAFAWIFALVALLVLSAAILIGLLIANQIARPIGSLIQAAERVRSGDLVVRVPESASNDEISGLSRAFNRMTGQLSAQRGELMDAYSQIDERRRFTETVLSGVSAGVIGLDSKGRIELPNRAAGELLGIDPMAALGQDLATVIPEFATLLHEAQTSPERAHTAEIQIGPPRGWRSLITRIGAETRNGRVDGFVITFDDITDLQSAQRQAAWADVARRIAHEIKNPLTPIQLSAERLKRRFAKEITSDPETFIQCADTIIRHVGDIGRMVNEFSSFARMPQPKIKLTDLGRIAREVLVLRKTGRPDIGWELDISGRGPDVPCDAQMMRQALANLLQNAEDAVSMRVGAGKITVSVWADERTANVEVSDDGVGLPQQDRNQLVEPYITHKPKGTGLGLAIVKKVMEDHGGRLYLDDRADGPGATVTLSLPLWSVHAS